MREIRFEFVFQHPKSKEVKIKRFTLQDIIEQTDDDLLMLECDCESIGETNVVECNCEDYLEDFTLISKRQYIGLKDKNGKEIYEGDIVKFEYYDEMAMDDDDVMSYSDEAQIAKVQSRGIVKGDFETCQMWLIDWAMDSDYIFEIIGNIYENPEVVK